MDEITSNAFKKTLTVAVINGLKDVFSDTCVSLGV